jgi:hypothetical protein
MRKQINILEAWSVYIIEVTKQAGEAEKWPKTYLGGTQFESGQDTGYPD